MAKADALAPASLSETARYLGGLPSRPRRGWWLAVGAIFAVTLTSMVLGSRLIGVLVDLVHQGSVAWFGNGTRAFSAVIAAVVLAFFLETVGRASAQYFLVSRARRLSVDIRRAALRSALRAPVPDIVELGTGNVITRLTKDIDTAVRTANAISVRLIVTVLMFPFTLVALMLLHPSFGLTMVLILLVAVPFIRANISQLPEATNIVSSAEARRNNMLLDTIRGLKTLQAFHLEKWGRTRMQHASWETVDATADRMPLFNRMLWQGTVVYASLVVLNFCQAGWLVAHGHISLGAAAAAVVLISRLEQHVFNIMYFAGEIQNSMTSLGRAVALASLYEPGTDGESPPNLQHPPRVDVRSLSYHYRNGAEVLSNLNLVLEPGTTTALVGPSGAGKSTLAAIIAGQLRITGGEVLIDGTDISRVPNDWTARQVVLVSQEVHLFSGTLREDLQLASPHATDDELKHALADASLIPDQAAWTRWLPEGLDTPVGAGAPELAPEVQQQISLARILLLQPPMVIMDEATADAGSDNARALEQAALHATQGRTALVVAHRLDQAQAADRVLYMENGRIIEDGTHEQLIAREGQYAKLYSTWAGSSV